MPVGPPVVVLRGADVLDGTGAPAVAADVTLRGDRIISVTRRNRERVPEIGATVIDLTGLALAPGFIDTHTHDDFAVLLHPEMAFKVRGGVTTCIVGNCGLGAAPHHDAIRAAENFHPNAVLPFWDGHRGYLEALEATPPSVNVAALIGHGTVRAGIMGVSDRAPTPAQLEAMNDQVIEGMEAGCLGLSTGLSYAPGRYAGMEELVALATTAAGFGGVYTSHIRDEGDHLVAAVDEAIEIGARSGAAVVISHLKVTGRHNWGRVGAALTRIAAARARGQHVAADQYPYAAAGTLLWTLVDQDAFGRPDARGSALAGGDTASGDVAGGDVVVATCPSRPEWNGRSVADIGTELGCEAAEAAEHIVTVDLRTTVTLHSMSEEDVRTVLATEGIMIGSDGLPTLEGRPHPRLYGTFARVLGHYRRDVGLLSLPEAIHRMTGRPAEVFGLVDRGRIAPGFVADLVAFDPATIADRATFDDPHQYPDGIVAVWVAGVPVVQGGRHTGARPGRVLRRTDTSAAPRP